MVPELEQSKAAALSTLRPLILVAATSMLLKGSLLGITPNLDWGLTGPSCCGIARSLRDFPYQQPSSLGDPAFGR